MVKLWKIISGRFRGKKDSRYTSKLDDYTDKKGILQEQGFGASATRMEKGIGTIKNIMRRRKIDGKNRPG